MRKIIHADTHAARFAEFAAGPVSPGFLLGSDETGEKRDINQYAGATVGTHGARTEAPALTSRQLAPGFLLGADNNDGKRVINQYAR